MNYFSLVLIVTACALTFAGCKKSSETVRHTTITQETTERVSGTHSATDIIWEEETDLK